ncbi:hypothetical protein U6A24_03690 [Aquimarina gracilis]|uniref:Uncharacterized protein n=1 Tax=Aquimarina gracilis TaxID=874422 RepID=A0ABU5ZR79_9FLAO|nr:hypothetical protein [Aquimarina gracilis]MEB3344547.1 hypothetical protein [Aquimarina gracilis]
MHTTKSHYDYRNNDEVDDVLNLVEKNIDCTNKLINHIDNLIESKYFPEPTFRVLTSIRNTCAVNVMNITRIRK